MINQAVKNVAIISGCCVKNDAISASVRDDALALSESRGFRSKVYSYKNELDEIDAVDVDSVSQIVFDPFFASCDLIIYHFGIYYDLFNAICIGNTRAPQVVRYHNMTPRELLPKSEWNLSERSWLQLNNLRFADEVWPVSDINERELIEGAIVPREKVEMIPLCVGDGLRAGSLASKSRGPVRILYVGRFVKAKGLVDLIQVAKKLKDIGIAFSLRLVGDLTFSHPDFIRSLKSLIQEMSLRNDVVFVGGVDDIGLREEYERAHVLVSPSYHEGFCKPVVEAMRHGCIPVTYDSYNLQFVARGLSRTGPRGDVEAMVAGIAGVARSIGSVELDGPRLRIEVDGGIYSLKQYEAAVDHVLAEYGPPAVSARLCEAASRLIAKVDGGVLELAR